MTEPSPWRLDRAGAWHFMPHSPVRYRPHVEVVAAIAQALSTRPKGVCWFWWAGCPAPVELLDNPDALFERWQRWKAAQLRGMLPDVMWQWTTGLV